MVETKNSPLPKRHSAFALILISLSVSARCITCISFQKFSSHPGVPGVWSMGLVVRNKLSHCCCCWNLTDVTLADEDTNSILTDNAIIGHSICNQCKWRHLVANFETNAHSTIWGTNLELLSNASRATWWPKVETKESFIWIFLSTELAGFVAGEIIQVIETIPWVFCASGNV